MILIDAATVHIYTRIKHHSTRQEQSKTGIIGRSIQGNQTSRNCYWKKKYLASKGKVCADISPWITITEAALEIRDQAGGFAAGDFFGFATTFFSGALRLVPAAAAAVFFGLAVAALFFGFAAALAGLAATVLAVAGLIGRPWEPPFWRRRSRAGQEKQSTEKERRRWRWIDPRVDRHHNPKAPRAEPLWPLGSGTGRSDFKRGSTRTPRPSQVDSEVLF